MVEKQRFKEYTMMKTFLLSLFLFVAHCTGMAQYPMVTIPGSEIRKITSAIVKNQEYELQISLPGGYKESNKKYPTIFVMDAQWDFPLVTSIYGQQYFDGFIPEAIIVGITWGGISPNPDNLRARDYTPTREGPSTQTGGADKFLDFMKQELFPFLDANFRVDSTQRVLMGCSLGGLFTLYSMFTHTDMFTGYVAASPAVAWDKEVLYKFETAFNRQQIKRPLRLYLTVGDLEAGKESFKKMSDFMMSRNYSNLAIRSKILENTGHSGTKSETYSRGLQFVFERPDLAITDDLLQFYSGRYTTVDGSPLEIKSVNNQLAVQYAPGAHELMKYAGNHLFYSNARFLKLVFSADGKTFVFNQYGRSSTFKKN